MNKQLINTPLNSIFNPFDVLFKDFLDSTTPFSIISEAKFHYPVDIKETDNGIQFDLAIVGVDKKDVNIVVEDGCLKVSYDNKNDQETKYLHRGITRKSFNFAWKLGSRFNFDAIEAFMDKGILSIKIPYDENNKSRKEIKII